MKKLNNKGFTLIELLAVIVILAILVALAVPSVTTYLNGARKSTYAINAKTAITAVRDDINVKGITADTYYSLSEINSLLDTKLNRSPYGVAYSNTSYIKVTFNEEGLATYSICLTDGSNGFLETEEVNVSEETLKTNTVVACSHS